MTRWVISTKNRKNGKGVFKVIALERKELTKIKNYMFESFSNIQSIDDNKWKNFNKNLLWYSFIESIGHIFYLEPSPGERFKRTLRELCNWEYTDKIITPLFYMYLKNNYPQLDKLINEMEEFCWGDTLRNPEATSRIVSAYQLNSADEIQKKSKIDKKIIDNFKLDNLLWKIRNMGIHARWQGDYPTIGVNDFCFVCDLKRDSNKKNWRIYIPEPFLQSLVKSALENFDTNAKVEINERDILDKILNQNFLIA